ncbi:MAG: AzlC family ABC transporter permease [Acidimicrobiales bacterium]
MEHDPPPVPPGGGSDSRRSVLRDALAVGAATGAYGLSFGAISATAGFSLLQTSALSLLMFTGASQFALVGVLATGGGATAAVTTATLLGSRNAFYGLRLSHLLGVRGYRKLLAAHLVIDESTAMAVARDDDTNARTAFWATGLAVFVLWNLATVLGALGTRSLADPRALGLDAAAPAAFIALLAPRLKGRPTLALAGAAGLLAVALTPLAPPGIPVLAAAALAVVTGWRLARHAGTA